MGFADLLPNRSSVTLRFLIFAKPDSQSFGHRPKAPPDHFRRRRIGIPTTDQAARAGMKTLHGGHAHNEDGDNPSSRSDVTRHELQSGIMRNMHRAFGGFSSSAEPQQRDQAKNQAEGQQKAGPGFL